MSDIRNYNDLLEEKERLEASLVIQKQLISQNFFDLKEEYRPVLDVLAVASKITSRSSSNPLIAIGVNLVGEIFLKNMLLSRSNKIAQFTIPFLAKKAMNYLIAKGAGNIFARLHKHKKTNQPATSLNENH